MSSEALEAKRLRENATRRNMMGLLMTCEPTDVLALLAEVARLEQERAQLVGELQSAEEGEQRYWAALAVARERKQRLRDALQEMVAAHYTAGESERDSPREQLALRDARAALVDEPAAVGLDIRGSIHPGVAWVSTPDPAVLDAPAAADEPGKTPA